MQQCGLVAMERRIEPEPALGRKVRPHVDVGDQEAIVKHLAGRLQAQHAADRTPRAIRHDQPVTVHAVVSVGCGNAQGNAIALRRHADHLVLPA